MESSKDSKTRFEYEEHADIIDKLKKNEYTFMYFHGQTMFNIPWAKYEKIGAEKLSELINEAYGEDVISDGSWGRCNEMQNSCQVELPPSPIDEETKDFKPAPELVHLIELINLENENV